MSRGEEKNPDSDDLTCVRGHFQAKENSDLSRASKQLTVLR